MKKIIKLTESDLIRIVKRVIKEQEGMPFKDTQGRTYKFPGIKSQDDLNKFLDWSNGQYAESIVAKLQELGLKGVVELSRAASELKASGGSPSGSVVGMMNDVIRELLRLMVMMNLNTKTPGLEQSLQGSFMKMNYIGQPQKQFLASITKQYPNFWEVFKKIAQQKIG